MCFLYPCTTKDIHHWSSEVSEDCSPLPASNLATTDFQSTILVEVLLQGCHLGVQGLLHQQLLSSTMVQHCGLLQVDRVVVLLRMLHYNRLLHNPLLAGISVFYQSHLQSLFCLSNIIWPQLQGIRYTTLDCLPRGSVSLTLVNIEEKIRLHLKITLMLNFLQTRLMSSLVPAM